MLQLHRPVIGMTLRYDRLDHFWFVLIHELVHVKKHLRSGTVESVFDDLEAEVEDQIEREADTLAAEFLITGKGMEKSNCSLHSVKDRSGSVGERARHQCSHYRWSDPP